MDLPNDSIGISDLIGYRECPRRMSYGMRRHTGVGLQSDEKTPEAGSWATEYGTAIHEIIRSVEDGFTDDEAVQRAWDECGSWLQPGDLDALREDLEVYRQRDFPNTRIMALEDEFRVPLFIHEGRQVYFRFKLDRLYERVDEPGTFIHVDYKSSRTPRTKQQVDTDLQMWAYWFGIHEFFPEADRVLQFYDQLKFGQVPVRMRGPRAHEQMREFLIRNARTILEDEDWRSDGLLRPKKNDWCAYCPLLTTCPVVLELSDFAQAEIAALVPRQPKLKQDGSPSKVMEDAPLDETRIQEYAERLEVAKEAQRILERFTTLVGDTIKRLPPDRKADLGYSESSRSVSVFTPDSLRRLHERLGPDFYSVISASKSNLESHLEDDPQLLEWALDQALSVQSRPSLRKAS